MSPAIANAVTGCGDIGISGDAETPWQVALVHKWDDGAIDPALSLVTVAMATQNPLAAAQLRPRYELDGVRWVVIVHFAAKAESAAALPTANRDLDLRIDVSDVRPVPKEKVPPDRDYPVAPHGAFIDLAMPSNDFFERSTKTVEDVIQRPDVCRGRIVVVFDGLNPGDQLPYPGGTRSGGYGHAMAIQSLWSQRITRHPGLVGQFLIPLAGAVTGLALAWPVVRRRSWWPRWAVVGSMVAWVVLTLIALATGVAAAWWMDYLFNPLVLIFAMVTTAVLWLGVDRLRRAYPLLKETRG
jgi:hypothetical protein